MNLFFMRSALAVMEDVLAAVLGPRTPITPVEWASINMVLPINAAEKLCQAGRVFGRAAAHNRHLSRSVLEATRNELQKNPARRRAGAVRRGRSPATLEGRPTAA